MHKLASKTMIEILPENLANHVEKKCGSLAGTPDFFDVIGQVLFDISYFIIIKLNTSEKHIFLHLKHLYFLFAYLHFLFAYSIRRYRSFHPHKIGKYLTFKYENAKISDFQSPPQVSWYEPEA